MKQGLKELLGTIMNELVREMSNEKLELSVIEEVFERALSLYMSGIDDDELGGAIHKILNYFKYLFFIKLLSETQSKESD